MPNEENRITGADGNEYVQRKMRITNEDGKPTKAPGRRVTVYNKLRSNLHLSDCILPPESEGSILLSDYNLDVIKDKVIKVDK